MSFFYCAANAILCVRRRGEHCSSANDKNSQNGRYQYVGARNARLQHPTPIPIYLSHFDIMISKLIKTKGDPAKAREDGVGATIGRPLNHENLQNGRYQYVGASTARPCSVSLCKRTKNGQAKPSLFPAFN